MRSTLIVSAFAALALAAPRPQTVDIDGVLAAPSAIPVTPGVEGTSQDVPIQPTADAISLGVDSVASGTTSKRDFLGKRDGNCAAQPAGTGPQVSTPDDSDTSFLAYQPFIDAANNAPTPEGYTLSFSNQQGSSQIASYLGYTVLNHYDTIECARYCDELDGCIAFNLYFERDPSVDPNAVECPNPASITNIKCVRWGAQVTAATAINYGQWRDNFHVVIAGSNGYNKLAPPPAQSGFSGPVELAGAINAPNDPVTNTNTYMGYKYFSFSQVQTYEQGVLACTAACAATTAYNARHPPSNGKPHVCNQVVVYVLSKNNVPQGVYGAMYTEAWAPEYATNYGQYRGSDHYTIGQAYAYTNATYSYPVICNVGGCPGGSYAGGNCGGYGAGTC